MESLSEDNLLADPLKQFAKWFADARACEPIHLPEAMCLSTVCSDGYPEGRTVLLKDFGEEGFLFYTNCRSPKGRALAFAPRAEMTFYWMPLGRQVRLQGDVQPVKDKEADEYFATRSRGRQLSAWASDQSEILENRQALLDRMKEMDEKFKGSDVPRPAYWGGYRLLPRSIEFWQDREDRLHDRFRFRRTSDGAWKIDRLYP